MAANTNWSFEQIVDLTGARTLHPPVRAERAFVQANGANVRYRLDGTAPTATVGQVLVNNGDMLEISPASALPHARFIEVSATANIDVHYRLGPDL